MAPRLVRLFSENNDFQHAEVLKRNRQKRQAYREFFLEGVRQVNLAIERGWEVRSFFYAPEQGLSDWAQDILRRSAARSHFELPLRLQEKLSGKTETSELIAVVAMPDDDLARIKPGKPPLLLVFDRPGNPGNLGTLIRTGDALGADGLVITGHGVDLYDPETISASRGTLFTVPVVRVPGPKELSAWIAELRHSFPTLQIVAAEEKGSRDLWEQDLRGPTLLLLGNERWGLSAAYRAVADVTVRIPMSGAASSLNVAVAGSILLYEVCRQRRGLTPKSPR